MSDRVPMYLYKYNKYLVESHIVYNLYGYIRYINNRLNNYDMAPVRLCDFMIQFLDDIDLDISDLNIADYNFDDCYLEYQLMYVIYHLDKNDKRFDGTIKDKKIIQQMKYNRIKHNSVHDKLEHIDNTIKQLHDYRIFLRSQKEDDNTVFMVQQIYDNISKYNNMKNDTVVNWTALFNKWNDFFITSEPMSFQVCITTMLYEEITEVFNQLLNPVD